MVFIYILLLELNKYYIGKTNYPDIRLDSHFNSNGSEWTKIYKPIKVYELISDCDSYDEDKYTLKYMEKEGIDNVRGGSFSQIKLSDEQIKLINQMIKGASDKYFNCGESGHFIKDCIKSKIEDYLKDINNENIQNETIKINSIYEEIIELNRLIKLTDFISMDDLPEIKKESQDRKKFNKLQDEHNKIQDEHNKILKERREIQEKNSRYGRAYTEYTEKINLISEQIRKYKSNTLNYYWQSRIPVKYREINNDKDITILGLEIIKFNLKKKKRLKEIFEDYYSKDFIEELLTKLYEKEIETI
jgi:predicted GIY-YIG superfamily endonuclease